MSAQLERHVLQPVGSAAVSRACESGSMKTGAAMSLEEKLKIAEDVSPLPVPVSPTPEVCE